MVWHHYCSSSLTSNIYNLPPSTMAAMNMIVKHSMTANEVLEIVRECYKNVHGIEDDFYLTDVAIDDMIAVLSADNRVSCWDSILDAINIDWCEDDRFNMKPPQPITSSFMMLQTIDYHLHREAQYKFVARCGPFVEQLIEDLPVSKYAAVNASRRLLAVYNMLMEVLVENKDMGVRHTHMIDVLTKWVPVAGTTWEEVLETTIDPMCKRDLRVGFYRPVETKYFYVLAMCISHATGLPKPGCYSCVSIDVYCDHHDLVDGVSESIKVTNPVKRRLCHDEDEVSAKRTRVEPINIVPRDIDSIDDPSYSVVDDVIVID
uniref:ORF110 n=1 Tax=Malaco herpesvirus 1 TaxID=3031797 RepID=A0AA48SFH4_9VIRU|nr:TPA_asm: ORF110 [Malaco herpesvirus 1]